MSAPAVGPALALAAGGMRAAASGLRADAPAVWALYAGAQLVELTADLLQLGAGWTGPHARAVEGGLCDALAELPGVSDQEAQRIARGVSAAVTVVRRWVAP
jgi:hypothetical protein